MRQSKYFTPPSDGVEARPLHHHGRSLVITFTSSMTWRVIKLDSLLSSPSQGWAGAACSLLWRAEVISGRKQLSSVSSVQGQDNPSAETCCEFQLWRDLAAVWFEPTALPQAVEGCCIGLLVQVPQAQLGPHSLWHKSCRSRCLCLKLRPFMSKTSYLHHAAGNSDWRGLRPAFQSQEQLHALTPAAGVI